MRAHLLLVKLPYDAEGLVPEINALTAILPPGSRRVIKIDQILAYLLPHTEIAEILGLRWRNVMRAFSNWWIIGVNGELACKNKLDDPFRTWMNEFRRTGTVTQMEEPKDVPFLQGRKPGIEPSVRDLIERTFGKVGLPPSGDEDGPEKANKL